jgi:hypothetical protein
MGASEEHTLRRELRELLRVARFQAWELDKIEDAITGLFRRGVIVQPPVTPDQQPGPSSP